MRELIIIMQDKWLNITEAAEYLGVSVSTLRRWDKSKKLTARRLPNGHRRYSTDDLLSVLKTPFSTEDF